MNSKIMMTQSRAIVRALIEQNPGIGPWRIIDETGMPGHRVYACLKHLRERGEVRFEGAKFNKTYYPADNHNQLMLRGIEKNGR